MIRILSYSAIDTENTKISVNMHWIYTSNPSISAYFDQLITEYSLNIHLRSIKNSFIFAKFSNLKWSFSEGSPYINYILYIKLLL